MNAVTYHGVECTACGEAFESMADFEGHRYKGRVCPGGRPT